MNASPSVLVRILGSLALLGASACARSDATLSIERELFLRGEYAGALAWSPDGSLLACSGNGATVKVFAGPGRALHEFDTAGEYVHGLGFSADGTRLIAIDGHKTEWAVTDRRVAATWPPGAWSRGGFVAGSRRDTLGINGAIRHVAEHPSGRAVAYSTQQGIEVWSDGQLVARWKADHRLDPQAIAIAADGRRVAIRDDANLQVFDGATGSTCADDRLDAGLTQLRNGRWWLSHRGPVPSPDGSCALTTLTGPTCPGIPWETRLRLFERNGQLRGERDLAGFVGDAVWSRDGRRVLVSGRGRIVILDGRNLTVLESLTGWQWPAVWVGDEHLLGVGLDEDPSGAPRSLALVRIADRVAEATLRLPQPIRAIRVDGAGRRAVAMAEDRVFVIAIR